MESAMTQQHPTDETRAALVEVIRARRAVRLS